MSVLSIIQKFIYSFQVLLFGTQGTERNGKMAEEDY